MCQGLKYDIRKYAGIYCTLYWTSFVSPLQSIDVVCRQHVNVAYHSQLSQLYDECVMVLHVYYLCVTVRYYVAYVTNQFLMLHLFWNS